MVTRFSIREPRIYNREKVFSSINSSGNTELCTNEADYDIIYKNQLTFIKYRI